MILVMVSIVPVLCLCGLTLYQLIKEAGVRHSAANARDNAVNYFQASAAVTSLLVSRLYLLLENKQHFVSIVGISCVIQIFHRK